jgi:2-hydroxychromene-2-carboxylate isomerase
MRAEMATDVEFFYDYVSVYSYLANSQLSLLEGADIVYRPMFLGAVLQATGNRPPATVAAKGRYLADDIQRWSKRYGVPLEMNPKFPQNTIRALRIALVAQEQGEFELIHERLFHAMWFEQADLEELDVLERLMTDAGLHAATYLAAIENPATKAMLKSNTDEAIRRGAFGAPTFFVAEEMFFGNDRFEFIREKLV